MRRDGELNRYRARIRRAAQMLAERGVVAYPTEGVYGLGCLPEHRAAVERLLSIKRRSWLKGLPLIAASLEQLAAVVTLPRHGLRDEILASWPGPTTWVLPARPGVPDWLTGGRRTLAVRVTAHPLARALCVQARSAIVSTSANRSGSPPLRSARQVRMRLGTEIDYILAGPLGGLDAPTPIRDGASGEFLRDA
ncbi:MAG TPA: Sua5/YciO/YrdC/YwlC family protein [Gammaproteobacteria bacterium]|jgi:L-threonylcarbamoyladenylate synthase